MGPAVDSCGAGVVVCSLPIANSAAGSDGNRANYSDPYAHGDSACDHANHTHASVHTDLGT